MFLWGEDSHRGSPTGRAGDSFVNDQTHYLMKKAINLVFEKYLARKCWPGKHITSRPRTFTNLRFKSVYFNQFSFTDNIGWEFLLMTVIWDWHEYIFLSILIKGNNILAPWELDNLDNWNDRRTFKLPPNSTKVFFFCLFLKGYFFA